MSSSQDELLRKELRDAVRETNVSSHALHERAPGRSSRRSKAIAAVAILAATVVVVIALIAVKARIDPLYRPLGEARVKAQSVVPMTYREWTRYEGVPSAGLPASELRQHGVAIRYNIVTKAFEGHPTLPVRIVLYDLTHRTSKTVVTHSLKVGGSKDCGCSNWVPLHGGRARYYIELAVFPPGAVDAAPFSTSRSRTFVAGP